MDFLAIGRQNDPGVRRGQSQERGLSHRRRCSTKPGAKVVYVGPLGRARKQSVAKLLSPRPEIYVCDVEHEEQIARAARRRRPSAIRGLHGLVHSIAFADYAAGPQAVSRDAQGGLSAVGRYFLLFADGAGRTPSEICSTPMPRS